MLLFGIVIFYVYLGTIVIRNPKALRAIKNTLRSKKKNRVGADQTFQLAIREISINRCQS
jgi:hypothetical protein